MYTIIFKFMKIFIMTIFKTAIYNRIYYSNEWVINFLFFNKIIFIFVHLLVTNQLNEKKLFPEENILKDYK